MPALEVWGPPTWCFFHVLAESINESSYDIIFPPLFNYIKRICSLLPCPDCSVHAINFLKKLTPNDLSSKEKFKNTFYLFHNMVNARKKKPLYNYANMEKYKHIPLQVAYNNFVSVYNTKGNMKLLTESFARSVLIKDFRSWILKNVRFFTKN